jgi:hypothetical protein
VSKGIVIPDYYPQIVPTDLFNKAQATKQQRKAIGGKEVSRLRNLFAGLASCSECGSKMYYQLEQRKDRKVHHKTKKGEKRKRYRCETSNTAEKWLIGM